MNWLTSIKKLLGRFWSVVFKSQDFLGGVETTMAVACRASQAGHDKWAAGFVEAASGRYADTLPFAVYIDTALIGRPSVGYDAILNGDAAIGAEQPSGYCAASLYPTPHPVALSDHVAGYTVTLLDGFDYELDAEGLYLFHVDPSTLHLPMVPLTAEDGQVHVYYKLFGWSAPSGPLHDAVAAFHGEALDPYAEAAWDMHQKGATPYNVKKLLAGVTKSVVCDVDGAVDHMWTEQGLRCMLVGDRVYSAPVDAAVGVMPDGSQISHGCSVRRGQVLFGSLRMYTGGESIPAAAVPGMHVMTDAGELIAPNSMKQSDSDGLPLEGDADRLSEYAALCHDRNTDLACPYVIVPLQVNPMLFILQKLRRGRAVVLSMTVSDPAPLSAALACIRRCTCATGMVNVYLQAESDTLAVSEAFESAGFAATAGEAAVSTVATVAVRDMFAEAQLTL